MKSDRRTVQFLPIKHGSVVDLVNLEHPTGMGYVQGHVRILGFKPGAARKREGWLIVLVGDGPAPGVKRKK